VPFNGLFAINLLMAKKKKQMKVFSRYIQGTDGWRHLIFNGTKGSVIFLRGQHNNIKI
jgi:hypothetical protein